MFKVNKSVIIAFFSLGITAACYAILLKFLIPPILSVETVVATIGIIFLMNVEFIILMKSYEIEVWMEESDLRRARRNRIEQLYTDLDTAIDDHLTTTPVTKTLSEDATSQILTRIYWNLQSEYESINIDDDRIMDEDLIPDDPEDPWDAAKLGAYHEAVNCKPTEPEIVESEIVESPATILPEDLELDCDLTFPPDPETEISVTLEPEDSPTMHDIILQSTSQFQQTPAGVEPPSTIVEPPSTIVEPPPTIPDTPTTNTPAVEKPATVKKKPKRKATLRRRTR